MADKKISALTASTTPLAGSEVLPIVQSGATVKVAVSDLTAGRAVATAALSATGIVLTTDATDASSTTAASMKTAGGLGVVKKIYVGDNIVQATAAKGIDFTANTPQAGMTSQLLNWYEEGNWTPTDGSGAGLTLTVSYAYYVRVGKQCTINMFITYPATASAAQATIGGLPFTIASSNYPPATFASNSGTALSGFGNATTKTISIGTAASYAVAVSNATMTGANLVISLTYVVS